MRLLSIISAFAFFLAGAIASSNGSPGPSYIPRVIHQTWKTKELDSWLDGITGTWKTANPTYTYLLHDDDDCLDYVREHGTPAEQRAYMALTKPVERADMFRYLVTYYSGGVYADMDTEGIVGVDEWEGVDEARMLLGWHRTREVCQWVFAGAPRHSYMRAVLDQLVHYALAYPHLPTLRKTGPHMFTDVLLRWKEAKEAGGDFTIRVEALGEKMYHELEAAERMPAGGEMPEGVVLLSPHRLGGHGMKLVQASGAYVHHTGMGSWKPVWAKWQVRVPFQIAAAIIVIVLGSMAYKRYGKSQAARAASRVVGRTTSSMAHGPQRRHRGRSDSGNIISSLLPPTMRARTRTVRPVGN